MDIKERREKVKKLVEEKKSNKEIAKELGIKKRVVEKDVLYLKKIGILSKKRRKTLNEKNLNVLERRKKVKRLVEEGKDAKGIAQELIEKLGIIASDITYLRGKGELPKERINSAIIIERREKVKELVEKGKTNKEIANELKITITLVANDIRYLREHGKLIERKINNSSINKRRKEVKKLVENGMTTKKIADQLGVTTNIFTKDIAYLKKVGNLSKERISTINRDKRRSEVKKLVEIGMTTQEIAQKLEISNVTIIRDISYLKKVGMLSIKNSFNIEERREKVKDLVEKGKNNQEIAQELDVKIGRVKSDISYLKKVGKLSIERRKNVRGGSLKVIKRREKIKELIKLGMTSKEMAEKLETTKATVTRDISYLKKAGEISKKRRKIVNFNNLKTYKRRAKVKELVEKEKSNQEIAQLLEVKMSIVVSDITYLKKVGKISKKRRKTVNSRNIEVTKRRVEVKRLVEEGKSNQEIAEQLEEKKAIVAKDVSYLRKKGEISLRRKKNKIKKSRNNVALKIAERRKKVKSLAEIKKKNREIAVELGISISTVTRDISYLRKKGELVIQTQEKNERKKSQSNVGLRIAKRREKVKKLVKEEKKNAEIANELGVSKGTIANDIAYLKRKGELPEKRKNKRKITKKNVSLKVKERREKVKRLVEEGKGNQEIADDLEVSIGTIANDIVYLKRKGNLPTKRRKSKRGKRKELVKDEKKKEKIGNKLEVPINMLANDMENIKRKNESRFKRIVNYIKSCQEIQQAIDYAKSFKDSKYLTEEERNKLRIFIRKSEKFQEENILKLCKNGKKVREIIRITKMMNKVWIYYKMVNKNLYKS